MNSFHSLYNHIIKENKISLITEQTVINEIKIRLITEGVTPNEEDLLEISKICMELHEAKWWQHGIAHVAGAIDPTGIIDAGHAIYYFMHDQILSGILTLIGAIPYIGDTAKLLIPLTKAGKAITNPTAVSAIKILINKMPIIQNGLTKLVNVMLKSKHMKGVLIKAFGAPKDVAKYATSGGKYATQNAPNIANHIVNKMINSFDSLIRKFAGPTISKGTSKMLAGQTAKSALYNMDFSEIPSLKKYSTASIDTSRDKEMEAALDWIERNKSKPQYISTISTPKKQSYSYKLDNN